MAPYHKTQHGQIILGDSLDYMATVKSGSADLIVTSPPFGLLRKKDYGDVESGEYIEWFKPFGQEFKRILKSSGSLVVDMGGAWLPGRPTWSLHHFKLCRELP
jgi:DNA modification methylase